MVSHPLLYCEGEVHIAVNTGTEKPERNLVTATELDTINSQEAVLDILDLIETLFLTAHLEQIAVIYEGIML